MPAMLAFVMGCDQFQVAPDQPVSRSAEPEEPTSQADYLPQTAVKADHETEGPTAVDSALEWMRKYTKTAETLVQTQKQKEQLEEDKRKLLAEKTRLETELERAQTELEQANALLIEMRRELEGWKKNVLGFRNEIRDAEKAQLEALAKVLRLLGGEVPRSEAGAGEMISAKTEESESETAE